MKKKIHRAWCMYDWANSAYNLVITTTIFPAYYLAISGGHVSFFGREFIDSVFLNYALATAYVIIAILSPILSSIADYKRNKKRFMQLFCTMGALACCGLFFFRMETFELGVLLAMVAAIGWCGSLVFYNAYLPEIAEVHERDKLSAQGYSYGYVGSVILQIICFIFVMINFEDKTFAARLSFLLVGLWWLGFAQIPFRILPMGMPIAKDRTHSLLSHGFRELRKVWLQIREIPALLTFLLAFFFYSMGVQTVMLASTEFVHKEITKNVNGEEVPMETPELIIAIVIMQLVAILGAMMMAALSKKIGNIKVLMLTVFLWVCICITAYFIHTDVHFYLIATAIGLVMGGIQSMSRSTYSKLMPPTEDTASFFSFYDVTEKVAIAIGLFTFGFMEHITGSMRNSIFALASFFVVGFIFLFLVQRKTRMNINLSPALVTESKG